MATILNIEDFIEFEDDYENDHEVPNKVSLWTKSDGKYTASKDVEICDTLPPGMYSLDYHPNIGYQCTPQKAQTDELFLFSDSVADRIIPEVQKFWDKKELFKEHDLIHKRGILLYGSPGTGKSSYINIIARKLVKDGGIVFIIRSKQEFVNYVDFVRNVFRKIQPDTNVISILEDIDHYEGVHPIILDFLDGHAQLAHHVVIATSNNTEELPDTFFRPSRLDLKIEVPLPSLTTRYEYFKNKKVDENLLTELAEKTHGCSIADLKEVYVCVFLLDYTIENAIEQVLGEYIKRDYTDSKTMDAKISL